MKIDAWFYNERLCKGETATAHREAYEKSLKSRRAVKVHSGCYYYRGYEVAKDGGTECPWNYNRPEADDFDRESAETKKIAMECIDEILKDEIDLCDIVCG